MNGKNIPKFTAEISLYKAQNRYIGDNRQNAADEQKGAPGKTDIILQLPTRTAPGKAGCIADCRDLHPTWTVARCALSCRDPGGIPGSGGGKRPADANAVCWAGYGICTAVGFAAFRPDLLASCLFGGPCSCEDIRDACLFH